MYPRKLANARTMRMSGYAVTLCLHILNLAYMELTRKRGMTADPKLQTFQLLLHRYFTAWNVMLQLLHAFIGLSCDTLASRHADDRQNQLVRKLEWVKSVVFASFVWPCTMVVFTVFWSVFLYDRSLIFPEFLDQIIGDVSNHIIHTVIVPIALWEIIFCPRYSPKSHYMNLKYMTIFIMIYLAVFLFTFAQHGVWLYPIFEKTYGTGYFFIVFLVIGAILFISYYTQWYLNYMFHGKATNQVKETVKEKHQ